MMGHSHLLCRMLSLVLVASIPTGNLLGTCPMISGCSSCENCSLAVNRTGYMRCVGSGLTLYWEIESEGFNMTILSDARNDSIEIEYSPHSCGGEASVICVADETVQSLDQSSSSRVTLFTEPCVAMDSHESPDLTKVLLAILLILLILTAAAGVLFYWRRSIKTDFIPQRLKMEELSSVPGKRLSRREFVKLLTSIYNERELPLPSLPLECDCILDLDDDVSSCSTTDLLEHEIWDININRRIMFIADVGYGKTTLARHVVHSWITNKTSDYILLYLSLANVDKDARFIEEVIRILPHEKEEITNMTELLKQNRCIVLLDGLNEFSIFRQLVPFNEQAEYRTSEEILLPVSSLRIVDLLEGKHHEYPQLRVWVTTRQKSSLVGDFREPYCAVHMKGVSKAEKQIHIEQSRSRSEYTTGDATTSEDPSTSDRGGNIIDRFLKLPATKDLSFFTKSPMIFTTFTQEYASNNPLLYDVTKLNYTTLVQVTLNILEYRFQQKIPHTSSEDEIENVHSALCKVALKQTMWKTTESQADSEISQRNIDIALLVGYLKLSLSSSSSSSDITIKFSHDFFQEYFSAWSLDLMENSPSWLVKKLGASKRIDRKTMRLLKFLYGFGSILIDKITDDLIETKQWDLLVDCLYEIPSYDRMDGLLAKLHQKKLVFNTDDTEFHFDAITELCVNCSEMKIRLNAIHLITKDWNDGTERLVSHVRRLQRNVKVLRS